MVPVGLHRRGIAGAPPYHRGVEVSTYSTAVLSDDGLYRYELIRRWGDDPIMEFIMLNPSTADATADDPTIRRCIGFAKREGFGGLVVRNLYAFRATNPKELLRPEDPFGPLNRDYLTNNIAHCTVVAWGSHKMARTWGTLYPNTAKRLRRPGGLQCLGTTADGSPRHPLYVPSSKLLEPWKGYVQ